MYMRFILILHVRGGFVRRTGMCIWDPSSESLKVDVFPEEFIHKEKIRTVFEDSAHQLYFLPDKGPMYISDLSMNHFRHLQPNTYSRVKIACL